MLFRSGERIPKPGVPESFRVLVKELQSLGLDLRVLDSDENEVELRDMDEDSNEHVNIDTLSRLAEAQEKKKLAEEEAEIAEEEATNAQAADQTADATVDSASDDENASK